MRRILMFLLAGLCLMSLALAGTPSRSRQSDYWGALAYSYRTGHYGFAYDYPTQAAAINEAVRRCPARDCRAVVWFHNGCGAFARGKRAWGWGIGGTRREAEATALAECQKRGGGCRVIQWACTTR